MEKLIKKSHFSQKGFTLIEVLIALTLFSVFIAVFLTSQGYNVRDSILLKEELNMRNLAEYKLNEVMLNPPEFTESMNNKKEIKNFQEEPYKAYKWQVTYKKLEVPDFSQLIASGEEEESSGEAEDQKGDANIQKMVMEKMKENIEKMIWQVEVKITKENYDEYEFVLTGWIEDTNAKVELNLGI